MSGMGWEQAWCGASSTILGDDSSHSLILWSLGDFILQKFQDLVRRTSSSPSSLSLVQLGCEKWYLGTSRPGGHCEDGRLGSPMSSEHPSCSFLVVSHLL